MAKKLGLQQRFRNRSAGNFDEGLVGSAARRAVMDRAGDQRLARARFARHQHRCLGIGHRFNQVEDFQHLVIMAHDVIQAVAQPQLLFEVKILRKQRLLFEGLLDGDADFIINDRLQSDNVKRFARAF